MVIRYFRWLRLPNFVYLSSTAFFFDNDMPLVICREWTSFLTLVVVTYSHPSTVSETRMVVWEYWLVLKTNTTGPRENWAILFLFAKIATRLTNRLTDLVLSLTSHGWKIEPSPTILMLFKCFAWNPSWNAKITSYSWRNWTCFTLAQWDFFSKPILVTFSKDQMNINGNEVLMRKWNGGCVMLGLCFFPRPFAKSRFCGFWKGNLKLLPLHSSIFQDWRPYG